MSIYIIVVQSGADLPISEEVIIDDLKPFSKKRISSAPGPSDTKKNKPFQLIIKYPVVNASHAIIIPSTSNINNTLVPLQSSSNLTINSQSIITTSANQIIMTSSLNSPLLKKHQSELSDIFLLYSKPLAYQAYQMAIMSVIQLYTRRSEDSKPWSSFTNRLPGEVTFLPQKIGMKEWVKTFQEQGMLSYYTFPSCKIFYN